MARERPTTSNDVAPSRSDEALRRKPTNGALSRAQAHALTRCAPLTKHEFKAQRQLADLGVHPTIARLAESPADPRA